VVAASLERLRRAYDVVLIEGAGSPAEINLRAGDLVDMTVAHLAEAPVLLVGDIDRGGVFAAFVGALALLPAEDRARVVGFVVNTVRGDPARLAPGFAELEARTGVDSLSLGALERPGPARLEIAVARLPRIANFDDFEPLAREPGVRVRLVARPGALAEADAVVLPGSRNTAEDLGWLRATGLADAIVAAARAGRPVLGICGGFQRLGREVRDPDGVESASPVTPGLARVDVVTVMAREKTTARVRGRVTAAAGLFADAAGLAVQAYEIHGGRTAVAEPRRPFVIVERQGRRVEEPDGAVSGVGNVVGTYLHGLFATDAPRGAWLHRLARARRGANPARPRRLRASTPRSGAC